MLCLLFFFCFCLSEVSGCQLNGSVADLLLLFAASGISRLTASGCDLAGEVPNIAAMKLGYNYPIIIHKARFLVFLRD